MKRTILLLTVMATMVLAYAGLALAQTSTAETLDANTLGLGESVNAYTALPGQKAVQTFTAEHNGQLTTAKLKIHLDSAWGSIDGAEVRITTVDPATGLPTSNVLASSTIPSSDIPVLPVNIDPASIPMTTLTFENPATVEAGKQYAIVMDTIAPNTNLHFLRWTTTLQDYSGGQGMWINDNGSFVGLLPAYPQFRNNASDQVFAIYLAPVAPDTTAPEVSWTSPSNYATGVDATANINVGFFEEGSGIDSDTLTTDTFKVVQVRPTGMLPVSGAFSLDEESQTATFDPSSSLAKGLYRVTITTGVEDKAGNALANDYTWTFATAGPLPRK
jgi:Bacterial Ig-like domain